MKSSNIKIGEKVYFKSDKYNPEDMYYTQQLIDCEKKEGSISNLDEDDKLNLSNQIKNNVGFTVEQHFDIVENDNDISVVIVDEDGGYFNEMTVDAKFFRSEKKHKKLMKRKQEENENA